MAARFFVFFVSQAALAGAFVAPHLDVRSPSRYTSRLSPTVVFQKAQEKQKQPELSVPGPPPKEPSTKQPEAVRTDKINSEEQLESSVVDSISNGVVDQVDATSAVEREETLQELQAEEQLLLDEECMRIAIDLAQSEGGERGPRSAYPYPTVGAILVGSNGDIIGQGRSDYRTEAVWSCLRDAGLQITALKEWVVGWPNDEGLRNSLNESTLYVTLEPTTRRRGTASPPVTNLIRQSGVPRVVIGCPSPVPEKAMLGATVLHDSGLEVSVGVLQDECEDLVTEYAEMVNSKLHRMARKHFEQFKRPLGFLHCSVIASDNVEAFARQGNALGRDFAGGKLSYRDFGSFELAPPPEIVWADEEDEDSQENLMSVDFEDEDFQGDIEGSPMMPFYEQVDAVVVTFPRRGNGPPDDDSVKSRLAGVNWLASHGCALPAGVERIVVMDATDLMDLPLSNDNPNLAPDANIEKFWNALHRKPTRILLRRGINESARAAAAAASEAAKAAANATQAAANAIETGDAALAAQAALECQNVARKNQEFVQAELEKIQIIRSKLEDMGVIVETLEGGEPIDVMNYLGERNGLYSVVWRAGCWGNRGVQSILAGAFSWISAHLAVDAVGGKFWQLMLAENCVQAACGPRSKVKVLAESDDIQLEYCDNPNVDSDCTMQTNGKPYRHVRLDARVALVDENRPREFVSAKTAKLTHDKLVEQAPWFL